MIRDTRWIAEYVTRRELIHAIGYRWDGTSTVWRKGKKSLTDEQIDRIAMERLEAYLEKQQKRKPA